MLKKVYQKSRKKLSEYFKDMSEYIVGQKRQKINIL